MEGERTIIDERESEEIITQNNHLFFFLLKAVQ
jgi:hypothetical protein